MLRRAVLLAAMLLVVSAVATPLAAASTTQTACSFPVTVTDATDTAVTVDAPPARVVVLGPSAAQTMWEIDGEDQVVGMPVDQYTDYLPGAADRVDIMNPDRFTVNIEQVVDLEPDLVLAPNVIPDDTVASLREAGLTVYKFRFAADIDDVRGKTERTGELTDNCRSAAERVDWMDERLEVVREAVADERRPAVIYPLGDGFVAGNGTFLHALIVTAGGENVAASANVSGYARISDEVIVTRNPEWLVLNEGLPMSAIQLEAYNRTDAIREDQVIRINPNYANQPAPRVVIAVETIAEALHPEAYAAANATATATPTAETDTGVGADTPTEAETPTPMATESPGQPGLGHLAAVVGLLALIVAGRARA